MGYEGPGGVGSGIWDLNPDWPTGVDSRSVGDNHIRWVKLCIQQSFPSVAAAVEASDEELNYSVGVTSLLQGQLDALSTRIDDADTAITSLGSTLSAPPGTQMIFRQANAPAGWTNAAAANDRMLRVVSGSGGGNGGSWTISGLSAANVVLTIAQMPRHRHGGGNHSHRIKISADSRAGTDDDSVDGNGSWETYVMEDSGTIINYEGSGSKHNHPISSTGSWRPLYTDVIIAIKS